MTDQRSALALYVAPLVAGVATVSTLATIGPVFSDHSWLTTSALVVAIIVGSGIVLRALGLAQAYVSMLQLVVGLYALLLLTTQPTMIAGFIPSGGSFGQLMSLIGEGATTARTQVAPITPTEGTATLLALLVAPVAVLVDDSAVTGRPALAGIPLLTLFAICSAIVRHPISMWLVIVPVLAFLLLLWIGERDDQPRRNARAGLGALAVSGTLALLATVIAAAATVVVRLPDGGVFAVSGNTDRSPNETVARTTDLSGQLTRDEPLPLFTVETDDPAPFYLRAIVLERWAQDGWSFTNTRSSDIDPASIPQAEGPAASASSSSMITVDQYSDIFVPTFYAPTSVNLPGAQYDPGMAVAYTADKGDVAGQTYEVTAAVPRPTTEELAAVTLPSNGLPRPVERNRQVPVDVDPEVISLTQQVTSGASSPWEVATALDAFFSDPAQGWVYTLEVPDPGPMDPLASFLDKRQGFCEQYASAMAAMFRISGVPARVVVGYTQGESVDEQTYQVSTDDAHAWVEAYFGEAGWIQFDPTPIGDRAVPLPYVPSDQIDPSAPEAQAEQTPESIETPAAEAPPTDTAAADAADQAATEDPSVAGEVLRWVLIGVLACAVLALPGMVRTGRWRSRLAAAAAGGRDGTLSAWEEVRELASDLGRAPSRTASESSQADQWAADLGLRGSDLQELAAQVERARYGADVDLPPADAQLRSVRDELRTQVGPRRWWRSVALPAFIRRPFDSGD